MHVDDSEYKELILDARRYRFLRDVANPDDDQPYITRHVTNDWGKWLNTWETQSAADTHIDAAIAASRSTGAADVGEDNA